MATVTEKFESRRVSAAGRNSTVRRSYNVQEVADEAAAITAILAAVPTSFTVAGNLLDEITVEAEFVGFDESGTGDEYECEVSWKSIDAASSQNNNRPPGGAGSPETPEDGPSYHISFGTTRARIYQARAQSLMTAGVAGASDIGTNLHDDGTQVEGLDVPVPTGRHIERRTYLATDIDRTWIRSRLALMRTVNSTDLGPYLAGELFFDELQIQYRQDGFVDVDFGFEFSPNNDTFSIAGQTFAKKGHQYVWARYTPIVSGSGKIYMTPTHVYLADIWEENAWTNLFVDP